MTLTIDLDDIVYRGRPCNSGRRDFEHLYEICRLLAAHPGRSIASAAREVVDTEKDYNAVDRLTGKLRAHPKMPPAARQRYERNVERFLQTARTSTFVLQALGLRSKATLMEILMIRSMPIAPEIMDDPRVRKAVDRVWTDVRPSPVMEIVP